MTTTRATTRTAATDTTPLEPVVGSDSDDPSGRTGDAAHGGRTKRRRRRSLRLRLTAVYTLLFLVCGTILLGVTYLLVDHATGKSVTYTSPDGHYTVALSGDDDHTSGTSPSGTRSASGPTSHDSGTGKPLPLADQQTMRALAQQQHADSMNQLLVQGGLALALATLASAGLGWWIAGRTLRPLRTMNATVRAISATNLHRRLALQGPPDELTELGGNFDALLDRLESSFEAQRQFVANASHELRTPLARQRAIGQVALDDPAATAGSLRDAHEKILQAGREQARLIEALLALARGQSGAHRRTELDLADLVRKAIKAHQATDPDITETLNPALVTGDPHLLERLVTNLIDNAVRHNIPHGRVQIVTRTDPDGPVLVVENTGPDLTSDDIDTFLKPFRRGTSERTVRSQGLGLGLPVVHAITNAHGAELDLRPRSSGGLHVEVRFPGTPPDRGSTT